MRTYIVADPPDAEGFKNSILARATDGKEFTLKADLVQTEFELRRSGKAPREEFTLAAVASINFLPTLSAILTWVREDGTCQDLFFDEVDGRLQFNIYA